MHCTGEPSTMSKERYDERKLTTGVSVKASFFQTFLSNVQTKRSALWYGQCIIGYKHKLSTSDFDSATPDNFYARFGRLNSTPISVSLPEHAVPVPPPFTVLEHEVRKLFKQQSSWKAAGRDNVSTTTLKHCANEFSPVFTDLFNASLHQHTVRVCFKAATIIPVPKKFIVQEPSGSDANGDDGGGAMISEVCH